ncbi:hypothetical protein AJ79_09808 [Helicocarpus griseus UAMH5409]|uniref:Uncharacterized protein n=1 Tax=Helicocarpus griseus UAMH5409 TaxID=1447875 RepID=A0A2B7WHF7_9EURO|nr:hypothetical protein AJ79_09808 [Helicocarpus griseus UAMH5409]
MAGNSNVGSRSLYEAGDQRNSPNSEIMEHQRNRDHPPTSSRRGSNHSKEQHAAKDHGSPTDEELSKKDPLAPAKMHGHQPSRGAQVDAELRAEDEQRLRQKGYK